MIATKGDLKALITFLAAFVIGLFLLEVASGFEYPWQIEFLCVAFFVAVIIAWGECAQKTFFLCTILTVSFIPIIFSNLYIESGKYISEQNVYGYSNGATIRLILYVTSFFIGVLLSLCFLVNHHLPKFRSVLFSKDKIVSLKYLSLSYYGVLSLLSIAIFIKYGSPLLMGEVRFEYWTRLPGVFNRIPTLISFGGLFLGVLYAYNKNLKFLFALVILTLALLFLFSEKFSLPFLFFVYLLTGFFVFTNGFWGRKVNLKKAAITGSFLLLLMLFVAASGYVFLHGYTWSEVGRKIIERAFGLQGHVWYGVDRLMILDKTFANPEDLFSIHTESDPKGLVMLMWAISPNALVEILREQGVRFTMGGPAIGLATLGYFGGAIYQFFAGIFSSFFLSYIYHAVVNIRFFSMLIGLIGSKIVINAFLMGDPYKLYDPVACFFYVLVFLELLLRELRKRSI